MSFLGGVSVVHPVLVAADVTQDCVLGIDVLGKHNCRIDLNGKSIKIGKEVVSLKGKNESSKVFGLSAFRVLKEKLVSAPVLAFPCFDQEFVVDCDASDYGWVQSYHSSKTEMKK